MRRCHQPGPPSRCPLEIDPIIPFNRRWTFPCGTGEHGGVYSSVSDGNEPDESMSEKSACGPTNPADTSLPRTRETPSIDRLQPRSHAQFSQRVQIVLAARFFNVFDVALPAREGFWLLGVDIKPYYPKPRLFKDEGKRQTDVAESDNADDGLAGGDAGEEGLFVCHVFRVRRAVQDGRRTPLPASRRPSPRSRGARGDSTALLEATHRGQLQLRSRKALHRGLPVLRVVTQKSPFLAQTKAYQTSCG